VIGALAKMATDVANLASTEVGEAAEPYVAGRGGSTAMPHKRNPVSCTVILAAHGVAPGLAATLLTAMAAAHERPAGLWHAEWHALPMLFGLASGALREARALAEGLEVDPARMQINLDATHGLLFADAAAARLGAKLGREAAHALVEHAANEVRRTGDALLTVLSRQPEVIAAGIDLAPAFDLAPSVAAACPWVDRAVKDAATIRAALLEE
jgi:3-carboxy-cis,cis-muconate cycloisomerase